MALRPTKTFLFKKVSENLKDIKKKIGIDFACGDGKNSIFFKTKKYIGLDLDQKMINIARKKFPQHSFNKENIVFFNHRKYSPDLIVSTNTFEHIKPKYRKRAFQNLINMLKKNGTLIIDSNLDNIFSHKIKILKQKFKKIKLIYFRNSIIFAIENFYLKNNFMYLMFKYSGLIITLTYLEHFTSKFNILNKSVLIIAKNKKKS